MDSTMQRQYVRMKLTEDEGKGTFGFLDQEGVFMDRLEALAVAKHAGQVVKKTPPDDRLFSEDMY